MSTTITDQIREYRRHAAAQLRMVEPHNRVQLAGRNSRWSKRSLDAYSAHGDARTAITGQLHLTGHAKLAAALTEEAHVRAALSWSKMSGKTNVGELTERLTALRALVRQLSVTETGQAVADFRRHAAAIRRLSRSGSDSARAVAALAKHSDACRQLTLSMGSDLAFALASEHNYLSRGNEGDRGQLALVRRVIARAAR